MGRRTEPKPIPEAEFKRDWLDGLPLMELSVKYGISRDRVTALRDEFGLPKRHDRRLRFKPKRRRDPTQREIKQRCLEIRAKWDEATEAERRVQKTAEWTVPTYEDVNFEALRDQDKTAEDDQNGW